MQLSAAASPPGAHRDRLLSWPKVRELTDLSRSTAWRRQKAGDFPLAVRISPGRVGWRESEVIAWMIARTHGERPADPEPPAVATPPLLRPPDAPHPPPAPPAASVRHAAPELIQGGRRRGRAVCDGQIAFDF